MNAFAFMSIPFSCEYNDVSATIAAAVQTQGLASFRVDQDLLATSIAAVIEQKLRECRLVIADISDNTANIMHEIGLAQALGKPLILITHNSPEDAPFNVRGLTMVTYELGNLSVLKDKLAVALSQATTRNEILRTMLVPSSLGRPTPDSRFVVAASPLSYRRAFSRRGGFEAMRRTYSDYVGIRGILQGFGTLYGFEALPDLVDPEDMDDGVIEEDMTLYCVASPKANRWAGILLAQYAQRFDPKIEFRIDSGSNDFRNVAISIFCDGNLLVPPGYNLLHPRDRFSQDFGLIVRGPNPFRPQRMVAVLAGRSSLGTEAACTAFLDVKTIQAISANLSAQDANLDDHTSAFYALVSMLRDKPGGTEEAIPGSLKLHQVHVLGKKPGG